MGATNSPELLGYKFINLDSLAVVNAGANQTQTIVPTEGEVWKIMNIYVYILGAWLPASSSGTHTFDCYDVNYGGSSVFIHVESAHNANIYIRETGFSGGTTEVPTNAREQYLSMFGETISFTTDNYLTVRYKNDSDVNSDGTNTRKIRVSVARYKIIEEEA